MVAPATSYTLRRLFLAIMATASFATSAALAMLCRYSARNNGLGRDDGSVRLLVGWRYTPTIIAVLFTQIMVKYFEDFKRTAPFARMARQESVNSKLTLLYRPRAWWRTVPEGLSRSTNAGRFSWILVFSSLASGVSVLAISTLSSSVFVIEKINARSSVTLES